MFNVVVVDNEESIAKSVARDCENCNLVDTVKYEISSEKFLDDLDENKYLTSNLFLLDIDMPISGDEIAKEIKEKYPESQIVFISDYSERGEISFKSNHLIQGVLDKPISKEKLYKKIKELSSKSLKLKLCRIKDRTTKFTKVISTADIIALTSAREDLKDDLPSNHIAILVGKECFLCRSSLKGFIKENAISSSDFVEISGSTIINKLYVDEKYDSDSFVKTKNGYRFSVSSRKKNTF